MTLIIDINSRQPVEEPTGVPITPATTFSFEEVINAREMVRSMWWELAHVDDERLLDDLLQPPDEEHVAAIAKLRRSLLSAYVEFGVLTGEVKPRKPRVRRGPRRARA